MFFGLTFSSPAGSASPALTFVSRRNGRDRRIVSREMEGRMAALDHAQALVEIDLNGKVVDVNARFLALLGVSDTILDQPYTNLLTEAERAGNRFRQFHDQLLRGELGSAR